MSHDLAGGEAGRWPVQGVLAFVAQIVIGLKRPPRVQTALCSKAQCYRTVGFYAIKHRRDCLVPVSTESCSTFLTLLHITICVLNSWKRIDFATTFDPNDRVSKLAHRIVSRFPSYPSLPDRCTDMRFASHRPSHRRCGVVRAGRAGCVAGGSRRGRQRGLPGDAK